MPQIQKLYTEFTTSIKSSFQTTVDNIKTAYERRISELELTIKSKDECIRQLEESVQLANSQLSALKIQNNINLEKIQSYKEEVKSLKNQITNQETISKKELDQKYKYTQQLQKQVTEQRKQIEKLIKQQEVFSADMSSMSKQEHSSFSFEISELFRNSPHEILNFLESIPGEQCKDPKEEGDMTCMFVSKDGLSLQKFVKINRTFLKRTIKEHQKRFRFVLIHKPDK